jgi:hypothetical protein
MLLNMDGFLFPATMRARSSAIRKRTGSGKDSETHLTPAGVGRILSDECRRFGAVKSKESRVKEVPNTLAERIDGVATALFDASGRMTRLAAGLGISRSRLFDYRKGARTERDIDGMLIDLIDRERDAAAARVSMLTSLRNQMLGLIARARNQERRDAA